jgi:diguanylate cyclase (GGDEF)-like protein
MTDAGRSVHAADQERSGIATPRFPLKTKLTLGAIGFLVLNVAIGLVAEEKQRQLGEFALMIHDRAFVTLTHLENALMAFQRAVDATPSDADPGERQLASRLGPVVDELDVVIDRAGSSEVRGQAIELRADLASLGKTTDNAIRRMKIAKMQQDFTFLVRRATRDGLQARDEVERFAEESQTFVLASAFVSGCFVLLVSILLGKAIAARQLSSARIAHLMRFDELTNLLNRTAFLAAVGQAIARAARGEEFALLRINLDKFKHINDTFGHAAGDAVLRTFAGRLLGLVRQTDSVARLGADEFAVLQTQIAVPDQAASLARRITESLSESCIFDDKRILIGASVGIALGDAKTADADTLMHSAELALFRAKQDGQGLFRFFERDMDVRAQARRQLEADLRRAIDRQEFELFYQPLISIEERSITQFEALIRWRHPQRGIVLPDHFIEFAEDSGLILPIGEWVLRTACREAADWPESVGIAVNISVAQFVHDNVVDVVERALNESGLTPSRLELGITETAMLREGERTLDTLHALRNLGVQIAMDDFGTGYSSLNYLRSFPFDKLKIDRGFIRDLGENAEHGENVAIVRAIAAMGQSLGIRTTAEGVETEQQMRHLVAEGCSELQGFFFSKPCPAGEVARLVNDQAAVKRVG